jgi:hypothetical protein
MALVSGLSRPFRASPIESTTTQGVALGWLVAGPLALTEMVCNVQPEL